MHQASEQALTTGEAAGVVGCQPCHVYYLLRTGKLSEPSREGGQRRWGIPDLLNLRRALDSKRSGIRGR